MTANSSLPSYASPPLSEVSIGLQFKHLEQMKVPHFGQFWARIKKDFPIIEHAPPIVGKDQDFNTWAMLPRIWFIDKSDTQLLQLQTDRLNFNWRFRDGADPYPRFHTIAPRFFELLKIFEEFLAEDGVGVIVPTVAELTYVNVLERGREWNTVEDISAVFKDFMWEQKEHRFLPNPKGISWAATFELPQLQGLLSARLKQAVRISDQQEIMQFDMVANYPVQETSLQDLIPWYELAHEWIVRGFDDLTRPEIQKKFWGKK